MMETLKPALQGSPNRDGSALHGNGRLMLDGSYMEISPPSVGAGAVMPDWPLGNSGNPGPILVLPAGTHSFYVARPIRKLWWPVPTLPPAGQQPQPCLCAHTTQAQHK